MAREDDGMQQLDARMQFGQRRLDVQSTVQQAQYAAKLSGQLLPQLLERLEAAEAEAAKVPGLKLRLLAAADRLDQASRTLSKKGHLAFSKFAAEESDRARKHLAQDVA